MSTQMKVLEEQILIGTNQTSPAILVIEVRFNLNGSINEIALALHGGPSAVREGDVLATGVAMTIALRKGVSPQEFVRGFGLLDECPPKGPTNHPSIKLVSSVWHFLAEWLSLRFKGTPYCRECEESVWTYRDNDGLYICPRCNFAQMKE